MASLNTIFIMVQPNIVVRDSLGNIIWANRAGGSSGDYANGIATDRSGNIYITGKFYGNADFGHIF